MDESHSMPSQWDRELARLREENQSLRAQLEDSQETLRAIQEGAVDALVIDTPEGQRVFTLQGGEHLYRALIEQMREGAATLTPEGVIHYCNGRCAEMLKLPLERVIGGRMEEFVAPADRAALTAMLSEGGGRTELALTAGDGTEVPALVSAISLRAEGPAAICLVVADLTERKRFEMEIRQLNEELEERVVQRTAQLAEAKDLLAVTLASIGDGVIVTDALGRITFLNREAERLTGWSSQEASGQLLPTVFRIVNADTRQTVENPVEKVLRLGTVVGLANHTILISRDGRETPIDDSGAPIRQSDGTVQGVVLVFRDFTQQKQAEDALQRSKADAEEANEAKSRFVANISHELRTPMNAILGMIDLAFQKTSEAATRDFLSTARESADLLLALLNDLLDCAKIESGKLELESAPFSLRRILDQTTQVLGVRASEKGISFSCRIPPEVPDALLGDQVRLRQIFLNLAGNGVKFTKEGEVTISARVESQVAEEACLEFAVRDTGIGISRSELDRIFRPFVQADASTTRRFGGTGLGLSICSSLVRLMGGRIWVESESGQGSTFYFTVRLPLAQQPPGEPETPDVLPEAARKLRILLVEDNPANQKFAAYILQERGHTVDIAANGLEGIRCAEQNLYDVVLMDVQMPGMDGLEATAAIRAREGGRTRMPIIAMTAHAMKGDRQRCLAAGMDGYLSKPINGQEMIALVESLAAGESADAPQHASPEAASASAIVVFDPELALTRCFNSQKMLADMIQCFFDEVDHLFPQMRAALEKGDLAKVGRLGHRMKGTVVYLGAEPARQAVLRVEQFSMWSGDTSSEAEEAISALEHECQVLKTALAEHPQTAGPMRGK